MDLQHHPKTFSINICLASNSKTKMCIEFDFVFRYLHTYYNDDNIIISMIKDNESKIIDNI